MSGESNSQIAKGLQDLHFGVCGKHSLSTRPGSFALCFRFGRRICKDLADGGKVEHQRQTGADAPAHRPCHPDAGGAQRGAAEHDGNADAQDQIGEGGDHKAHHHAAAAQDAVGDQLDRHHEVEGRQDAQKQHTGVDGRALRVIHEQQQQEAAEEEVQEHDGHADDPHQIAACTKALVHTVHLAGTHVLGGVVGNAVAQSGED